jgi:hypothetical protein
MSKLFETIKNQSNDSVQPVRPFGHMGRDGKPGRFVLDTPVSLLLRLFQVPCNESVSGILDP